MILKITYSDEDEQRTEYTQISGIDIDEDKLFGMTNEDDNTYFEIEAMPEQKHFVVTRHVQVEDANENVSERYFKTVEVLTDALAVIQKWEAQ